MDFYSQNDVRADDDIRAELLPYLQSQYAASPTIIKLLEAFREDISPEADIKTFYRNVMDIETAVGEGLDVWGRIVALEREVVLDDGTRVTLGDDDYRRLLMYKCLANITDASGATLNKMMKLLYPQAPPAIVPVVTEMKEGDKFYNGTPMVVRWYINGHVTAMELALFKLGGTLCLGAGVGWDLVAFDVSNTFGFLNSGLQPFNQGTFWDGSYIFNDKGETLK